MKDTVQFLEDQQNLDELLKPNYNIFEPCVIIGDRNELKIQAGSRIDSFTKIEIGRGIYIGRGVHIASFAHLGIGGGALHIGDYAAVASGGKIVTGSNQVDAKSCSPLAPVNEFRIKRSFVILARYSCVFTNATVCPGVTLHEGAVLLPGGVATKDIPAWEIWGGAPAKFIRKREVK